MRPYSKCTKRQPRRTGKGQMCLSVASPCPVIQLMEAVAQVKCCLLPLSMAIPFSRALRLRPKFLQQPSYGLAKLFPLPD